MIRGLGVFALVTILLSAAIQACSGPTRPSTPQDAVEAQATNVRRTAVAEVQRILANNPPPTPTSQPTPMPKPTCAGAIWWHEARLHLGQTRSVQGMVVATRLAPDGAALLEIGQPYPDPTGIGVLVPANAAPTLKGQMVCAAGRVTAAEGFTTLQVRDPASIVVVKPNE